MLNHLELFSTNMECTRWQSAKVLKNGGECNDKGCLALELLDRSKIGNSFITGTAIKFRWLTSNIIVYGVVKSIEKRKFFIEKADGLPTSTWLDALKSLSNNTLVHVQKITTWEDPQLQVFYTQDKNDDDDSHNESDDGEAVGDAISDLLNPVSNTASNNNFVDPFNTSDNPEQIVDNINDAIVDGNINSSDLGTDLEAANYIIDGRFLNTGHYLIGLACRVAIQQSRNDIFFVASIPANNLGFGFTYTTQVPFKVIQGRSSKLLSTLYNDFKSKKISVSMRVEDNNETPFHKEINDVRAVTINGRQTYQFITLKDAVDGSMIGKYKNAMVTFKVQDWDPAGNNIPVVWSDNTQRDFWFSQNEQKWTRACISQKSDETITFPLHINKLGLLKKGQLVELFFHPLSNPLYCIVGSVISNAAGLTCVLTPANGYLEDEWKDVLRSINVNQECLVFLYTPITNGIVVSYTPSKLCTFLPGALEGITKPEVLGNVLNNCGFTPIKAMNSNLPYSTFSFQSKMCTIPFAGSVTIPANDGHDVKVLNATPGIDEGGFRFTVANKILGELFVDVQINERLRQALIEELRRRQQQQQQNASGTAATVDEIISEIKKTLSADVLAKPFAANTLIQIADLKTGKLIIKGHLVNLLAITDKNCNKTWQFDVECDNAIIKIDPSSSLTFMVTSELMTVSDFIKNSLLHPHPAVLKNK